MPRIASRPSRGRSCTRQLRATRRTRVSRVPVMPSTSASPIRTTPARVLTCRSKIERFTTERPRSSGASLVLNVSPRSLELERTGKTPRAVRCALGVVQVLRRKAACGLWIDVEARRGDSAPALLCLVNEVCRAVGGSALPELRSAEGEGRAAKSTSEEAAPVIADEHAIHVAVLVHEGVGQSRGEVVRHVLAEVRKTVARVEEDEAEATRLRCRMIAALRGHGHPAQKDDREEECKCESDRLLAEHCPYYLLFAGSLRVLTDALLFAVF